MEYVPPHPAAIWPLCANILDPVRLSVVCKGPSQVSLSVAPFFTSAKSQQSNHKLKFTLYNRIYQVVQVVSWFLDNQEYSKQLQVLRIKNRFSLQREQVI